MRINVQYKPLASCTCRKRKRKKIKEEEKRYDMTTETTSYNSFIVISYGVGIFDSHGPFGHVVILHTQSKTKSNGD
jgi:hypothetical protein